MYKVFVSELHGMMTNDSAFAAAGKPESNYCCERCSTALLLLLQQLLLALELWKKGVLLYNVVTLLLLACRNVWCY
jgi:hypothetical protein